MFQRLKAIARRSGDGALMEEWLAHMAVLWVIVWPDITFYLNMFIASCTSPEWVELAFLKHVRSASIGVFCIHIQNNCPVFAIEEIAACACSAGT